VVAAPSFLSQKECRKLLQDNIRTASRDASHRPQLSSLAICLLLVFTLCSRSQCTSYVHVCIVHLADSSALNSAIATTWLTPAHIINTIGGWRKDPRLGRHLWSRLRAHYGCIVRSEEKRCPLPFSCGMCFS